MPFNTGSIVSHIITVSHPLHFCLNYCPLLQIISPYCPIQSSVTELCQTELFLCISCLLLIIDVLESLSFCLGPLVLLLEHF